MTDKFDPYGRFELQESDSKGGYQVLVFNEDDLEYWTDQAEKTGHLIAFDCHIPENWAGQSNLAHDICQIFPPEIAHKVHLRPSMVKINENES